LKCLSNKNRSKGVFIKIRKLSNEEKQKVISIVNDIFVEDFPSGTYRIRYFNEIKEK
jgi:hypothetical protein